MSSDARMEALIVGAGETGPELIQKLINEPGFNLTGNCRLAGVNLQIMLWSDLTNIPLFPDISEALQTFPRLHHPACQQ